MLLALALSHALAEGPPAPPAAPPPPAAPAAPAAPDEPTREPVPAVDPALLAWIDDVRARVTVRLRLPVTVNTAGLEARAELTLSESRVTRYTIVRGSGNALFDRAVLLALDEALPGFAPAPSGLPSPVVLQIRAPTP